MIEQHKRELRITPDVAEPLAKNHPSAMASQTSQLLALAGTLVKLAPADKAQVAQHIEQLSGKLVKTLALAAMDPQTTPYSLGSTLRSLFKAEPGQADAVKQLATYMPHAAANALRFQVDFGDREQIKSLQRRFGGLVPTPANVAVHARMLALIKRNALSQTIVALVDEAQDRRALNAQAALEQSVATFVENQKPKAPITPPRLADALTTFARGAGEKAQTHAASHPHVPAAPAALAAEVAAAPSATVRDSVIPRALSLRAVGVPLSVHLGRKVKHEMHTYADQPFGKKYKFSRLINDAEGLDLVMTSTLFTGSFGKVRLAVSPSGEVLAVKEMRLARKSGLSKSGSRHTSPQAVTSILAEAQLTQNMRTTIDKAVSDSPLGMALERDPSFVVVDVVEVAETKKVHVVMTREAGDLFDLLGALEMDHVPTLARTAAAQCFAELAALHDVAHYTHLDIKLENIFFDSSGQTKLMDFGLAQPVESRHGVPVTRARGLLGTIIAPEMVATPTEGDKKNPRLSPATDVWSMGIAIASISGVHSGFFPFLQEAPPGSTREQTYKWSQHLMKSYTRWYAACPRFPDGWIDISRIKADDSPYTAFFSALIDDNPKLANLLINGALNPDPAKRLSASEVARFAARLLPHPKDPDMVALRQSMQDFEEANQNIKELKKQAKAYRAWDAMMRAP